jgi:hypothetical protein
VPPCRRIFDERPDRVGLDVACPIPASPRTLCGRHCCAELVALKAAAAPPPAVACGQP